MAIPIVAPEQEHATPQAQVTAHCTTINWLDFAKPARAQVVNLIDAASVAERDNDETTYAQRLVGLALDEMAAFGLDEKPEGTRFDAAAHNAIGLLRGALSMPAETMMESTQRLIGCALHILDKLTDALCAGSHADAHLPALRQAIEDSHGGLDEIAAATPSSSDFLGDGSARAALALEALYQVEAMIDMLKHAAGREGYEFMVRASLPRLKALNTVAMSLLGQDEGYEVADMKEVVHG